MGKKRNKKRLQVLSKQKLLDTNATAPPLPMKVATNATTGDHNFYDKSQIRQRIEENLREKEIILQGKRDLEEKIRKNDEILQEELQEKKKIEENIKKQEGKIQKIEQVEYLQAKMEYFQAQLEYFQKEGVEAKRLLSANIQKQRDSQSGVIDAEAYYNKCRAVLFIQEEQKLEYLYTEEIIYCIIQRPKLVKYDDTYTVSQQLVFVDTKTVEMEEEEVTEILQVHTHSEQASVKIHLDECMEECSLSKPTVFKQQVYKEVHMEEEELKDLEEFTSKPETANCKIQADPLERISAITEVIVQNNVKEGENEEFIKTQVKLFNKEVNVLKQYEEDLQENIKVQDEAVQELFTSFKQRKIKEEILQEDLSTIINKCLCYKDTLQEVSRKLQHTVVTRDHNFYKLIKYAKERMLHQSMYQDCVKEWKQKPPEDRKTKVLQLYNPALDMAEDPILRDTFSATRKADTNKCLISAPIASTVHTPNPPRIMGVNGKKKWFSELHVGAPVALTEHTPNPPGIVGVKWCMPPIENDGKKVKQNYPKQDDYLKKVKKKTTKEESLHYVVKMSLIFTYMKMHMVSLMAMWMLLKEFG